MTNSDQLDLFDVAGGRADAPVHSTEGQVPETKIVPFPLARRRGKIVKVARTLSARKSDKAQHAYWRRIIMALNNELEAHGASEALIDREIDAFYREVCIELSGEQPSPQHGPGAA